IELKYTDGQPAIQELKRVSKPGRRQYSGIGALPTHYNGLGVVILSTSKGVMSDGKARVENIGGEVLAEVF
ncbi:MAG: 30S ribosomal protein S8, partial [Pseudomonadota bacterium]